MTINFPSSPSNNQLFVAEGKAMRYVASKGKWKQVSTLTSTQITDLESRTVGVSSMSISGNTLVIQKDDSSYANVSLASFAGNKLTSYANASILPLSDLVSGTQVYVEDTDSLYITDGSGWYKIATVNLSPSLTLGVESISLSSGGSVDVNYTVNEPEDTPYTVTASSTSNATITVYQANNTITFNTPVASSTETITITATDGVNSVGDTLTMTITLGPDWSSATQQVRLKASNLGASDFYGKDVTVSGNGDIAVVGAENEDTNGVNSGSVYVYNRSGDNYYNLNNATWTYQFTISSQFTNPSGFAFNSDGSKVYICGFTSQAVGQYSLPIPYSVYNMSYDSVSLDVSSQETTVTGIAFNTNGTKLFTIGSGSDSVNQYNLSTGFDLSTASFSSTSVSLSEDTAPAEIKFKPDGTKMYMLGGTNDTVYQYSLSSAFDISTLSYESKSFSVTSQETLPHGLTFNADGTKMYIVGQTNTSVYQYSLSTAWDVSTASYDSVSFSVAAYETVPHSIEFNPTGTRLFVTGRGSDKFIEYELSPWSEEQRLSYPTGDRFGKKVAINKNGDTLVIGSDVYGGFSKGAIWIYALSGGTWSFQQQILGNTGAYDYLFGRDVDISNDGNTIAILSRSSPSAGGNFPRARIYTRSGSTWSLQDTLDPAEFTSSTANWYESESIAISGDGNTVVFGSPDFNNYGTRTGAAWIFTRSGSTWTEQQRMQHSDAASAGQVSFSHSVGISANGNTIVSGGWKDNNNTGALYVFTESGGTWSQQAKIVPNSVTGVGLGRSASISEDGTIIAAGAPYYDTSNGAVYIFKGSGSSWSEDKILTAYTNPYNSNTILFAQSSEMSANGETLIVGAYGEDTGGADAGAAFIYNPN